MEIQLTHLLPEDTYESWIKLAVLSRLILQAGSQMERSTVTATLSCFLIEFGIDADEFDQIAIKMAISSMRIVHDPKVFIIGLVGVLMDSLENPQSHEEFIKTMTSTVHMISLSYGYSFKKVSHDLSAVCKETDAILLERALEKWQPDSKGAH